jgi:hypothetical protein
MSLTPVTKQLIKQLNQARIRLSELSERDDDAPSEERASLSIEIADALVSLCAHTHSPQMKKNWIMQAIELAELERFRACDLPAAGDFTGQLDTLLAQAYYLLSQNSGEIKFLRLSKRILKSSTHHDHPNSLALLAQIHVLESKPALSRYYLDKLTQHPQFEPRLLCRYPEAQAALANIGFAHLNHIH